MTKQEALELLNKSLKDMTPEERARLKEAIKLVSTFGPNS
jgi:hypothetical protein